jgi:hypothetical protein
MGYIYCITNKETKKKYIGQSIDYEQRWDSHKNRFDPALYDYRILCICFDDKLHLIESYYINKYNTLEPNGYNKAKGSFHYKGNFLYTTKTKGFQYKRNLYSKAKGMILKYNCSYCKSSFANKSNLNYHLKTNRTCMKLRGEQMNTSNSCEICNKIFTTKANLNNHIKTCKKDKEIKSKSVENKQTNGLEVYKNLLDKQKIEYDDKLNSQKLNYEERLNAQKLSYEDKLTIQKLEYENKLSMQKIDYEYKLDIQKMRYEFKLEQLEKQIQENKLKLEKQQFEKKTDTVNKYVRNSADAYLDKLERIDLKDMNIPRNDINYIIYKDPKQFPRLLADHLANQTFLKHKVIRPDINRNTVLYLEKNGYKKDINGKEIVNYMFDVYNEEIVEQLNSIISELQGIDDMYMEGINNILNDISNNLKDTLFFDKVCKEFIKSVPNITDITRLQNMYAEEQPNVDTYITFKRDMSINNSVYVLKEAKLKELENVKVRKVKKDK